MKLAEALIERSDLQRKVEIMRSRMRNNAKIQVGSEPNENPADLIGEFKTMLTRLEYLVVHINKTNELTITKSGETISALIAKKDRLSTEISVLGDLLRSGSELVSRVTHSEIIIKSSFNVAKLQKDIDALSKELRLTDTLLQEANWLTDLIE